MTIGGLLTQGWKALKPLSATPRLDAEVLLARALGIDRASLIRDREEQAPLRAERDFRDMLERRKNHEPVHYIAGHREFWSLTFKLNHGVFIPRPETELVVETALGILREEKRRAGSAPICVADLGTGCGNIAVALAKEVTDCVVYAVDVSRKALECARENIEINGVAGRVELMWGDLLAPLSSKGLRLNMIVSNPPYVLSAEMDALPPEVRDYEPSRALHGGGDGLCYLRQIIERSPEHLKPGGALVLETGMGQGAAVLRLMERRGAYRGCNLARDYAGLDRVASAFIKT